MSLKLGNTDINKGYLGGTEIKKAYLGNTIVFDNTSDNRFTITRNVASNGELVTLPVTTPRPTDWGDGNTTTTETTHVYQNSGVYQIKIDGIINDWSSITIPRSEKEQFISVDNISEGFVLTDSCFNDYRKTLSINNPNGNTFYTSNLGQYFRFCLDLITIDLRGLDSSGMTSGNNVFLNCQDLEEIKHDNSLYFGNNANFSFWFSGCNKLNQSLSWIDFSSARLLNSFMQGKSSANYDYQYYDELLIKWDSELDVPNMTSLTIDMGTIQYSSAGSSAHASLVAKGLIITDGGQNAF